MTALELAGRYYDAWQNKRGDFSGVPLRGGLQVHRPGGEFRDR